MSDQRKANSPIAVLRGHISAPSGMWPLVLAVACALLAFGFIEPRIFSIGNLRNIAVQTSYLAIFAMAQAMVILTRGFDLSLGFTVSMVSVVAAMAMTGGEGGAAIALGVACGLATALAIGGANGVLIGWIGINPLVVTLGMSYIVMAFATTVSGGFPVGGLPAVFNRTLAQSAPLGIPMSIWIAGTVFLALHLVLKATRFGRSLYIIGANPRAAVAAGIRTVPILVAAYMVCSLLAALGAVLLTARTGSGEPNLGGNLTLEAIAAAVVGGVRLSGGEGGVAAAVLGAFFITILSNGMNLVQVDGYIQQMCLGVIIILSLIASRDGMKR